MIAIKIKQNPQLNPGDVNFYLTDQEIVRVSNIGNNFSVGYSVFELWPNSDFLYFILSYYVANFDPYCAENQSFFGQITDYKFLFDPNGDFSLPPYKNSGEILKSCGNLYNNPDDLDTEIIRISQKNMRNIEYFREMFTRKEIPKSLEYFLGSSKLEQTVYGSNYQTILNIAAANSSNYTRINRFDFRYMEDYDKYNKNRKLDSEDEFNIARAKILAIYTDREEFLNQREEKYFDHRLDNRLDIYKKYFYFYRCIKDKNWTAALILAKSQNDLFGRYLPIINYEIENLQQQKSNINPRDLKKISDELYYSHIIKNEIVGISDIQNLKNNNTMQNDLKFYFLTLMYGPFPEYKCDFILNTLKINFIFFKINDPESICKLYSEALPCNIFLNRNNSNMMQNIGKICNND